MSERSELDVPVSDTWWCLTSRDAVVVHGSDAGSYLQAQLSQDISQLATGEARWTFLLEPTGKINVLARVMRAAPLRYVLDTDAGFGDALEERLHRFLIRTKAEVERVYWPCIAVRGPGAKDVEAAGDVYPVPAWWIDGEAVDLLGAQPQVPVGLPEARTTELEAARLAAGWPAMGAEITESSIPAETGLLDVAVSFSKGCYPGQELVERMHARGAQAPRQLRQLLASEPLTLGAEVVARSRVAGTVTSVAGPLGLAVLARAVKPPDVVYVDGQPATVVAIGHS
jgi:tRNA-modifying protein YgfZ